MRIAVFGLGYVGSVTGACLARMGHQICGVDISAEKVRMINDGVSPVFEKGLEGLTRRAVRAGLLRATSRPDDAVRVSDLSLVCVGTPSRRNGSAKLDHVERVLDEIGRALRVAKRYHTVALRSTVPPGTMGSVVVPRLERAARKKAERDFGVCFHPEFLREGSSVRDFFHPPKTVIGALGPRSARRLVELWRTSKAPTFITSLSVAEMVKYTDNAFHALKAAYANEVGALSKSFGVDSHEVMRIFIADRKLNISPLYLRPGLAFGGPCLPKDLRAICSAGKAARLDIPLLSSVLESNQSHLQRAKELVLSIKKKRIGILGLVFKSGTDDLRESPACALVKGLLAAGKNVRVFEPRLDPQRLIGSNRLFMEKELPALPKLLVNSGRELARWCEVLVVAGSHATFEAAIGELNSTQAMVDLVRVRPGVIPRGVPVAGICW